MPNISKRIVEIVKHIPQCDNFVEVGCDHGYITYLVKSANLAKNITVTDISLPSLQKCKNLLNDNRENVTFVHTDGLKNIPRNLCDVCVIAGMGGMEIIKILRESYFPDIIILQPMKDTPKVREFLFENNYNFITDKVIKDDKFYDLIVAELNAQNNLSEKRALTDKEKLFGIYYRKAQKELIEKLKLRKDKIQNILNTMPNINAENIRHEYILISEMLNEYA